MAKIPRKTQVLFGTTGLVGTGGFGAAAGGNTATELSTAQDIATIMGTSEWVAGWLSATLGASKFPPVEDMNALAYTLTTQLAYLFQAGIAEYDAGTTYFIGSICLDVGTTKVYKSITNNNIGNALSSTANWTYCGDLTSLISGYPEQDQTGTTYAFAAADEAKLTKRSNSGTAMADTLPGGSSGLSNGVVLAILNADTKPIVLSAASGTINFYFGAQAGATTYNILPGRLVIIVSGGVTGGTTANYRILSDTHGAWNCPPTKSSFKKLSAAWGSNTTFTIAADEVVLSDSNNNTVKAISPSVTVNSASSGANGLDTGTLAASTWYFGYLIQNPATGTVAGLMSASATAPTLPSGYTLASGPLTAAFTDGSKHFLGFQQYGRNWQYVVGNNLAAIPALASGSQGSPTVPTWISIALGALIPTAIAATGIFMLSDTSGSNACALAPNNSYGGIASTTNPPPLAITSGTTDAVMGEFVLESTNVYYAGIGSSDVSFVLGFTLNI